MNKVQAEKLKVGDIVRCFDDEGEAWIKARVTLITDKDVHFEDITGVDVGWKWEVEAIDLLDDDYFKYYKADQK